MYLQELNTQQDFKDHDLDHPSVERIPLMPRIPFPKKKKEYRCPTCNKKFKNETSLNYHSMFHTTEEKPSEPTSSAKTTTAPTAMSSVVLSTTSMPSSASKPVTYDSSDSDSDNDSRHLSLKHISNSVKRITESQKKMKPNNQTETLTDPKVAKKSPAVKTKLECEICKKKFKDPLAFEYHKITFHVQAEARSPRESDASDKTSKLIKSKKTPSEKPKKRKSESNLEDSNIKKQKIVSEKSDKIKSKLLTGIFRKTQRQVSDMSEDDNQSVIQSIKSTLSMMHRGKKKKPSPSRGGRPNYKDDSDSEQSEDDSVKRVRKPNLPQRKKEVLSRKYETSESGSESSDEEDEYVSKKSVVKKNLTNKTIEKEFQSHSIDAILRSKDEPKEKKKLPKKVVKSLKKPKTVTSDSEPEIVKKEEKPEIKIEIVDSEDESTKMRESLLSTKNSKVKCEGCNKTFKNTLVLNYHQLHCEIPQTSKSAFNLVEKSILSSKKSSESPADKILKKLTETAKTCEKNIESKLASNVEVNKSKASVSADKKKTDKAVKVEANAEPKVKRCDVSVQKINKDTMNKFKDDLMSAPNAKKPVKSFAVARKTLTKQTALRKSKSTPSLGKASKPQCPQCGKKYADIMALNYHKITFHVEEKETELFSSSAYHEQMSFDKNVLKLNNAEGRRLSLETKSEAFSPRVMTEEPGKITGKPKQNIVDKRKSIEKTDLKTIEKKKSIEKSKPLGDSKGNNDQLEESSSEYCVPYCNKPERDDMLG